MAEKKTAQQLLQLLKQRKSVLSRHGNTLIKAIDAADAAEVSARLVRLKGVISEIEQLFEELMDIPDLPADDVSKHSNWFDEVENSYFHFFKLGNDSLKPSESKSTPSEPVNEPNTTSGPIDPKSSSSKPAVSVDQNFVNLLSMPKLEIECFDGDPLKFHSFMRSFKLHVGNVSGNSDAKIAYLLQYTKGAAYDAIKGVCIVGGDHGYQRALDTLNDLYGSKHVVVQKIIQNLRNCQRGLNCIFSAPAEITIYSPQSQL